MDIEFTYGAIIVGRGGSDVFMQLYSKEHGAQSLSLNDLSTPYAQDVLAKWAESRLNAKDRFEGIASVTPKNDRSELIIGLARCRAKCEQLMDLHQRLLELAARGKPEEIYDLFDQEIDKKFDELSYFHTMAMMEANLGPNEGIPE